MSMKRQLAAITAQQTGKTVEEVMHDGDRDRWSSTAAELSSTALLTKYKSLQAAQHGVGKPNYEFHRDIAGPVAATQCQVMSSEFVRANFLWISKRHKPHTQSYLRIRIVFLGVQVDAASADDIMAQLLVLESPRPRSETSPFT